MAGYKRSKTYTLVFEDEEFEGLEVKVAQLSVGDMIKLRGLVAALQEAKTDLELMDATLPLFELMGRNIKSWNLLDDDDQPVKPSAEAFNNLDLDFAMAIITGWQKAAVGVPAPLDGDSPSGETPPEEALAMASRSLSPAS